MKEWLLCGSVNKWPCACLLDETTTTGIEHMNKASR